MEEMEMLSTFTTVLHVSNLSTAQVLKKVLQEVDVFTKNEIEIIYNKIGNRRYHILLIFQ